MNKKKKKHWTTKNRHIKRFKKRDAFSELPMSKFDKKCLKIASWIAIIGAVLSILVQALDNHLVGYDRFTGIPYEWIKWLK